MPMTLNCPRCGQPLTPVRADGEIEIWACVAHGVFHFGPHADLTPGMPQPTE